LIAVSITNSHVPVRVLLVEDHPDLAAVTAEFLAAKGLNVRTALSGRDALDTASVFQPELVLCDLNLPDMSGLNVADELRSNPLTRRAYVVIVSASAGLEADAARFGVDAFAVKPLTSEVVRTLVNAAASARQQS
jgi:CheY-like chemotaxis protein